MKKFIASIITTLATIIMFNQTANATWHNYIEENQLAGTCTIYVQTWDPEGDRYSYLDRVDMSSWQAGREINSFQIITTVILDEAYTGTLTVGTTHYAMCMEGRNATNESCDIDGEYFTVSQVGSWAAGAQVTFVLGRVVDSDAGTFQYPDPNQYEDFTAYLHYDQIPVNFTHRVDMVRVNDESNANSFPQCNY